MSAIRASISADRVIERALERLDLGFDAVVVDRDLPEVRGRHALEVLFGDVGLLAAAGDSLLADEQAAETRKGVALDDGQLVFLVGHQLVDLLALDLQRALVLVDAVAVEHAHFDDRAGRARRHPERGVANVRGLFAEDGAEELLLRRHRRLALRRHLADEDVARLHFSADGHDARFVEVAQGFLADVRDVAGDLLRPELGVAGGDLELLDVDRGEHVVAHDALGDEDRVLEVVAVPRHERDEHVAAERQFAEVGRRPVGDDVAFRDLVVDLHDRALVDARVLVRALVFRQAIDIDARLGGVEVIRRAHDDTRRVNLLDHAAALGGDGRAAVARHHAFEAGADQRGFRLDQRHGLALHVRAHQRAVGVIVLEERDERRGDGHDLLGRHVDVFDAVAGDEHGVARRPDAGVDELVLQVALGVHLRVRLGDRVALFFHRREVFHLVGQLAVLHPAVRAFDEAVLVDAGVRGQRVDQADVRALRRFDRADAAVVRRVHVAHLEARALAGKTARPERRETTLVRDLGQRVGLVHELRELRGAEELAHGGHHRLRVDQVVRHDGVDIDRRHAFLDRALHADEADAERVLEQLAHRTDAAVAEVVDVVDFALAVLEVEHGAHHGDDVFLAQRALRVGSIDAEAHVHLHAADGREVVALAIEEELVEQRFAGFERRRLAGTHDAVDVGQGVHTRIRLVDLQRVAQPRTAGVVAIGVEQVDGLDLGVAQRRHALFRQLVAGFGVDLAGCGVDDVLADELAFEEGRRNEDVLEAVGLGLLGLHRRDLLLRLEDDLAGLLVDQIEVRTRAFPAVGREAGDPAGLVQLVGDLVVERVEDLARRHSRAPAAARWPAASACGRCGRAGCPWRRIRSRATSRDTGSRARRTAACPTRASCPCRGRRRRPASGASGRRSRARCR